MIEVIVTMCLIGTPLDVHPNRLMTDVLTRDSCQVISRTYDEEPSAITPMACMQNSAKFAIKWLEQHPGFQVRKLGCRPFKGQDA